MRLTTAWEGLAVASRTRSTGPSRRIQRGLRRRGAAKASRTPQEPVEAAVEATATAAAAVAGAQAARASPPMTTSSKTRGAPTAPSPCCPGAAAAAGLRGPPSEAAPRAQQRPTARPRAARPAAAVCRPPRLRRPVAGWRAAGGRVVGPGEGRTRPAALLRRRGVCATRRRRVCRCHLPSCSPRSSQCGAKLTGQGRLQLLLLLREQRLQAPPRSAHRLRRSSRGA